MRKFSNGHHLLWMVLFTHTEGHFESEWRRPINEMIYLQVLQPWWADLPPSRPNFLRQTSAHQYFWQAKPQISIEHYDVTLKVWAAASLDWFAAISAFSIAPVMLSSAPIPGLLSRSVLLATLWSTLWQQTPWWIKPTLTRLSAMFHFIFFRLTDKVLLPLWWDALRGLQPRWQPLHFPLSGNWCSAF